MCTVNLTLHYFVEEKKRCIRESWHWWLWLRLAFYRRHSNYTFYFKCCNRLDFADSTFRMASERIQWLTSAHTHRTNLPPTKWSCVPIWFSSQFASLRYRFRLALYSVANITSSNWSKWWVCCAILRKRCQFRRKKRVPVVFCVPQRMNRDPDNCSHWVNARQSISLAPATNCVRRIWQ